MKSYLTFLLLFLLTFVGLSAQQKKEILPAVSPGGITATHVDVKYGDHERNVFDLWLADADTPTALVIYVHGGGFVGGDKSKIYEYDDIDKFLAAGISFASINYRFMTQLTTGIPGCLQDSKRALQFIRSKAKDWNIDKERIGMYGASAGAGTSLWIGLHDEMAEPTHEDPLLRESTRVKVIGAIATQATYDFSKWDEVLKMKYPSPEIEKASLMQGAMALGLKSVEEMEAPEGKAIAKDVDFLTLVSEDDPPVFIRNKMDGGPINIFDMGQVQHHPYHALALKEALDAIEHESQVYAPGLDVAPPKEEQMSLPEYFIKYLK